MTIHNEVVFKTDHGVPIGYGQKTQLADNLDLSSYSSIVVQAVATSMTEPPDPGPGPYIYINLDPLGSIKLGPLGPMSGQSNEVGNPITVNSTTPYDLKTTGVIKSLKIVADGTKLNNLSGSYSIDLEIDGVTFA